MKRSDNIFWAKKREKGVYDRYYKRLKRISDMTEEELKSCEPVALEDVLPELGWKCRGYSANNFFVKLEDYYIQWSNSEQLKYLLKMKHIEKDDFMHIHDVRYLHQLQNLFEAFTGIKLPNVDMLIKG